jgi:hypothetical protein
MEEWADLLEQPAQGAPPAQAPVDEWKDLNPQPQAAAPQAQAAPAGEWDDLLANEGREVLAPSAPVDTSQQGANFNMLPRVLGQYTAAAKLVPWALGGADSRDAVSTLNAWMDEREQYGPGPELQQQMVEQSKLASSGKGFWEGCSGCGDLSCGHWAGYAGEHGDECADDGSRRARWRGYSGGH